MAKKLKLEEKWHRFHMREDYGDGELVFVAGKRRAYFSTTVSTGFNGRSLVFGGPKTLRAFAQAILREIPA